MTDEGNTPLTSADIVPFRTSKTTQMAMNDPDPSPGNGNGVDICFNRKAEGEAFHKVTRATMEAIFRSELASANFGDRSTTAKARADELKREAELLMQAWLAKKEEFNRVCEEGKGGWGTGTGGEGAVKT